MASSLELGESNSKHSFADDGGSGAGVSIDGGIDPLLQWKDLT